MSYRVLPPLLALACAGEITYDTARPGDDTERPDELPTDAVTVAVGPSGGELRGDGVTLVVPAGALPETVEITVTPVATEPEGYDLRSAFYSFEPDGLVFAEPVEIALELREGADADTRLYWSTPVGGWGRVEGVELRDGALVATVAHFSTGFAAAPGPQTEVFAAPPEEALDVLFVVDDSCSMAEEQASLAAQFPDMLAAIVATGLDWHVGVVTTDTESPDRDGRLVEASTGEAWVTRRATAPAALFADLVVVGTAGAASERGLLAAYHALQPPTQEIEGHNAGFHRPDGQLVFVVVSDEEDQSAPDIQRHEFVEWAQTFKPDPSDVVTMQAIVGPPPAGCRGPSGTAVAGIDYVAAAQALGGVASSICGDGWTNGFQEVIARLHATECQALALPPVPATLQVFLHPSGAVLPPEAWGFDEDGGCVFLTVKGHALADGSDVGVTYEPR